MPDDILVVAWSENILRDTENPAVLDALED